MRQMAVTRKHTHTLLVLCAALLAAPAMAAAAPPPAVPVVRLAVLADKSAPEMCALADLLTVELAKQPGVETVERDEIERVLAEHSLSAGGLAEGGSRIILGKILRAQGLIFISQDAVNRRVLARLVETRQGFVAGFVVHQVAKQETVAALAPAVIAPLLAAVPKLSLDATRLKRVALLDLKNSTFGDQTERLRAARADDPSGRPGCLWTGGDLPVLLTDLLCREPDVIVLERHQLGKLLDEAVLANEAAAFAASDWIIDGELSMKPGQVTAAGLTDVVFTVRFLDRSLQEVHRIEQPGELGALHALVSATAIATRQILRERAPDAATVRATDDFAAMLAVAQRYNNVWTADAAHALQPTNAAARRLLIAQLVSSAGAEQLRSPVTRELLLRVALPLARATRLCHENNLPALSFINVGTGQWNVYFRDLMTHILSRTDPELLALLRPLRVILRRELEQRKGRPLEKALLLAEWSEIFLEDWRELRPYREALFQRIITDAESSDREKDQAKAQIIFQSGYRPELIEQYAASDDPVCRFYAQIARLRMAADADLRRMAGQAALREVETLLGREGVLDGLHGALQDIAGACPEHRQTISEHVLRRLNALADAKDVGAILALCPEEYLLHVAPAAALDWIDRSATGVLANVTVQSEAVRYHAKELVKKAGELRTVLVEENHDHLQVRHTGIVRNLLLSDDGNGQAWPVAVTDLVRQFKTAVTVYPQRLLIEGDVLWIAWGGVEDHSGPDTRHPCGLMQVDARSGKLLSWRAGLLPGDRMAVVGSNCSNWDRVKNVGAPYAILPPFRWKDKIVVAQSGVGVLLYPAAAAGHRDLRDVQVINQQTGLINNAVRNAIALNDDLFITAALSGSRHVLMVWNATDRSARMLLDGGQMLTDWQSPIHVTWGAILALKTDPSRNCLEIVRMIRGGGSPFSPYGVWSHFPATGQLAFDRVISKDDGDDLTTAGHWPFGLRGTPKAWPDGLAPTFDVQDWRGGTLAITGPGAQWRLEHFLPSPAAGGEPANGPADFTTALLAAAHRGEVGRIENMVARGAAINATNAWGTTALMLALEADQTETAFWLIRQGIDIFRREHRGVTALMVAARRNQLPVVEELLKRGVNPNEASNAGTTVLMFAARAGHMAVVQRLLARGADPSSRNREGDNAADYAVMSPDSRILLHFIDDIVAAGRVDRSLLRAVCQNRTNNAALLLARGANINREDTPGKTLLHRTVEYALPATVQFVIDHGARAQLEVKDRAGNTPLLYAGLSRSWATARVLLRAGADPLATGEHGWTFYDYLHNNTKWDILLDLERDLP